MIAIIAAAGDAGLDRVQLQKAAFLVGEEYDGALPENFYRFEPYFYGPFSQEVYADVERLCDGPLVETVQVADSRPKYRLAVEPALRRPLSHDLESCIYENVGWVSRMQSFGELLRAIYYLYPEQRENSLFEYAEDRAIEESLARSFRDLAEGRTRPVDELLAELRD